MSPILLGRDLLGESPGEEEVKDRSKTSTDPCFYPEAANLRMERRGKKGERRKTGTRCLRTEKAKHHYFLVRVEKGSKVRLPE